jgi:hypothetical protein
MAKRRRPGGATKHTINCTIDTEVVGKSIFSLSCMTDQLSRSRKVQPQVRWGAARRFRQSARLPGW